MITKRPLFYWVRSTSIKLQALLLFLIVVTVGARVIPLEMQKRIVNEAISLNKVELQSRSLEMATYLRYRVNGIPPVPLKMEKQTALQTSRQP